MQLIAGFLNSQEEVARGESEERDEQGKVLLCPLSHVQIKIRLYLECHGAPLKGFNSCFGTLALAVAWRRGVGGRELPSSILTRVILPSRRCEPVSQL